MFAPSRHIGIGISQWGDHCQCSTGFFGQEAGSIDEREIEDAADRVSFFGENQGYGASARITTTPILEHDRLLHLGFAAAFRTPDLAKKSARLNQIRFRSRPETHVNRTRFVHTGQIDNVQDYSVFGVELAGSYRSLSFQGEYMITHVNCGNMNDARFEAAYIQLSWLPTGESRPYISSFAEFGSVIPDGNSAAWELAVRYSMLDLNDLDKAITGGREDIVTFGLNCYVNSNVRIMLNYAIVNNDENATGEFGVLSGNDDFHFVQTRFQATF